MSMFSRKLCRKIYSHIFKKYFWIDKNLLSFFFHLPKFQRAQWGWWNHKSQTINRYGARFKVLTIVFANFEEMKILKEIFSKAKPSEKIFMKLESVFEKHLTEFKEIALEHERRQLIFCQLPNKIYSIKFFIQVSTLSENVLLRGNLNKLARVPACQLLLHRNMPEKQ